MGDINERDKLENDETIEEREADQGEAEAESEAEYSASSKKVALHEEEPDDELDESAYRSSIHGVEKSKTPIFVVLMFVFLIAGVAGGIAIDKFALKDSLSSNTTSSSTSSEAENNNISSELKTITNTDIINSLDMKIDAYEQSGGLFTKIARTRPFSVETMQAYDRMKMVMYTMKNDELKLASVAMSSGGEPWPGSNTIKVPIERINEEFEKLIGRAPTTADYVDFRTVCEGLMGTFTYDAENAQYVVVTPEYLGCGGTSNGESRDTYRDSYEMNDTTAYVTIEAGSTSEYFEDANGVLSYSYLYNDFDGGEQLGRTDEIEGFDYSDYVNEDTKDKYTKYQYVFDKTDSGEWALRGLYPLGAK